MNANILPVGSNRSTPYLAFGDDSRFYNTLVFAVVIIPRTRLKQVETSIARLKDKFDIPAHVQLHCRTLFSLDKINPAKTEGLSHLSLRDVHAIIGRVVTIMNQSGVILRYAVTNLPSSQAAIGKELRLENPVDGSYVTLSVTEQTEHFAKGMLVELAKTCFSVPPGSSYGPTAWECEIFLAEDPSRIKFIGPSKAQVSSRYGDFYLDFGTANAMPFKFQPLLRKVQEAPMLQLADIAAYMCSHMTGESDTGKFLQSQLARVRYRFPMVR
ncbi:MULTISPECIES: hypothetical protein [Methylocaldum]|uniref:hypothetical protein n=1 Tax=Methylocaldum sp. 14B TaxID=1912213 RepID=UPI00098A828F|nr:hypothetical protein [Methylocaldum sp. 14B]